MRLENRQWFADTSQLRLRWTVTVDGVGVGSGHVDPGAVAPRTTAPVDLGIERPAIGPGQEAWLTVEAATRRATDWAPRGHVVAWQQFALPGRARPPRRVSIHEPIDLHGSTVRAGAVVVELDRRDAVLAAVHVDGAPVLVGAPRLALWRAPTDNDGLKLFLGRTDGWTDEADKPLARWLEWGLDDLHRVVDECSLDVIGGTAVLDATASLHGTDRDVVVRHHQRVQVFGSGDIVIDERVELPERFTDVARVGVTFTAAAGLEQLQWLGLGPDETYPDRRRAATVGRWTSTVTDQLAPYLVPQEHGLHLDTRWFALDDGAERGLLVGALEPTTLGFSAGHHTADDLWRARDLTELVARDEVVVHLDARHRGVGTLSCGPDTLPQHRIAPGPVAWRWRLRPYRPARDDVAALARQVSSLDP